MALSFLRLLRAQSPVTLFPVLQPQTSHYQQLQIGRETSLLGSLIPKRWDSVYCLGYSVGATCDMVTAVPMIKTWLLEMPWNLVWLPCAVLCSLKSRHWRGLPELSGSYLRGHLLAVFFPASPLLVPIQEQLLTLAITMDLLTQLYLSCICGLWCHRYMSDLSLCNTSLLKVYFVGQGTWQSQNECWPPEDR